jgi:hypothetical protein
LPLPIGRRSAVARADGSGKQLQIARYGAVGCCSGARNSERSI